MGKMRCFRKWFSLVLVLGICLIMSACFNHKRYRYYKEKDNCITVTGTVSHIKYADGDDYLVIALDDMSQKLSDNNFKIMGQSLAIVQSNEFDELVDYGTEVTITLAPRYFGDGYLVPIVAMDCGRNTLLAFEDGYKNLLNSLS